MLSEQKVTYCARSGTGPPCVVGHSVIYEPFRVLNAIVLGWMTRTTLSVASNSYLDSCSNFLLSNRQVIVANLRIA